MEVPMKKILFVLFISLLLIHMPNKIFALDITSPNAILIEMESGKVIYEKEADTPTYPASTTKIMTAILALENCDLNDSATASYDAVMSIPYDGSTAAIQIGETWTIQQLLEAMMICSANEAANILAEHIGGSIESFASMMNARAKELGATNTHFMNANGLHNDQHQTTVHDMAILARYAMLNFPEFRAIVKMTQFSLPNSPYYDKGNRNFTNTNKLLLPSSSYYYEYATGIKTGYTNSALNCIVASANKDGVELIAVVFGALGAENRTKDVKTLFEYGFEKLKAERFLFEGEVIDKIKISGATSDNNILSVVSSSNVVHTIPKENTFSDYEPQITWQQDLKAPISSGDIVGTISYNIEGNTYQYDLVASHNVESFLGNVATVALKTTKAIGKVIFWAVLSVLSIFLVMVFLRASIITKRQSSRRRRMISYNARFRR